MRWRKWNPDAPQPKRYRLCLVQLAPRMGDYCELPPAVVVGYVKWGSFLDPVSRRWRKRPYWVCPGVGGPKWEVTHYTTDLPEDMNAPGWPGFLKKVEEGMKESSENSVPAIEIPTTGSV